MNKSSGHEKAPSVAALEASDNVNRSRKNVEMNNSTAITPDNLPAIRHAGKPVVTTALLAKLYGTDDVRIRQNYKRNADRFAEGKHYVKLEGAPLKDLKDSVSQRYSVDSDATVGYVVGIQPKAKSVMLWTERGAARHAKMLDTNEAWEVFERLEDSYFKSAESASLALLAPTNYTLIGTTIGSDGFHCLSAVIDGKISRLDKRAKQSARMHIWSQVHKAFSVVSAQDIPAEQLDAARNFVAAYSLEGQYLPKPQDAQFNVNRNGRYLLSFNHKGEQQITQVADDAYVLSQDEFLKGIAHMPGDIPITTDGLFEFAIAALSNLRLRAQCLAKNPVV